MRPVCAPKHRDITGIKPNILCPNWLKSATLQADVFVYTEDVGSSSLSSPTISLIAFF